MAATTPVSGSDKPVVAVSLPGNQVTVTAGQAVVEPPGGATELAKPVEPGLEAGQTQCPV